MNPVVLVFLALAALYTYWAAGRLPHVPEHHCTGDTCALCQAAIDIAEEWRDYPDPSDAPRDWEPR